MMQSEVRDSAILNDDRQSQQGKPESADPWLLRDPVPARWPAGRRSTSRPVLPSQQPSTHRTGTVSRATPVIGASRVEPTVR